MPIFGSKFSPKKTPLRKSLVTLRADEPLEDLVSENRTVRLRLGDQENCFENGNWIPESGDAGHSEKYQRRLKARIQELEEENNMLRLKYEILLNMLTQSTAESHLQQREIDKLKRLSSRKL